MTEKLDAVLPRIAPLLRMLSSGADGEVVNAVSALRRVLANAGLDIHVLVERIESPGFSESEMTEICDKAYAQGHADGAEHGRRSAIIAAAQPMGIFADDVGNGINGYSWLKIAQHCARNIHRLSAWEREFAESMAEKLTNLYSAPTPKQAASLRRIFCSKFAGRIE
jgi:hypothetical protein